MTEELECRPRGDPGPVLTERQYVRTTEIALNHCLHRQFDPIVPSTSDSGGLQR